MRKARSGIGTRILDQLAVLKKSQKELAKEAGITEVSLSRYISGERTPNMTVVVNLARALHITTDYLLIYSTKPSDFAEEYETQRAWIMRNADRMTAEQRISLARPLFI